MTATKLKNVWRKGSGQNFKKPCDIFYTISVKELVLSYKILLSCLM